MQTIDILIVLAYLIATLVIGFLTGRGIKSLKEYAISNREFNTPVLVATISATLIGGGSSMGLASKVFTYGIPFFFIFMGRPLITLFLAYVVAPRMQPFEGSLSIADMAGRMYGKTGQVVVGVSGIIRAIGQVAAQVAAIGFAFQYFLGIDLVWGASIGTMIIVLYTSYGGIRAVTFTDVFQFALLVVMVPLIANAGIIDLGGYSGLFEKTKDTHFILPDDNTILQYLIFMLILELVPNIDGETIQKLLTAPDVPAMERSLKISALLQIPFYMLIAAIGLVASVIAPELDPNTAMPHVINTLIPTFLRGLCVAAIIAIVMSTADSFLNIIGIMASNDVIKPLTRGVIKEKNLLIIAKFVTLFVGVAAIVIALSFKDILDIGLYFANFWFPIAVMPLYAGIFGLRPSGRSFLVSVVGGVSFFLGWEQVGKDIAPLVPAFLVGMAGSLSFLLTHYHFFDKKEPKKEKPLTKEEFEKLVYGAGPKLSEKLCRFLKRFYENQVNIMKYGDMPVISYGVFTLLIYNVPSFMWEGGPIPLLKQLFYLKVFGSFLCIGLLLQNYWPGKITGYFPTFWHASLCYNLPFVLTLYALASGFQTFSLINLSFGLFLLGLLTTWQIYMSSFIVGVLGAIGMYKFWCTSICVLFPEHSWIFFLFAVVFATMMGSIFSRQRENILDTRFSHYRSIGAQIAHELRTPLQSLNMATQFLKVKIAQKGQEDVYGVEAREVEEASTSLADRIGFIL